MLIGLLAETFIHPGSGQSASAIDLPVAREATTGFPFIAGSSLKGAFRDSVEQMSFSGIEAMFGKSDGAGALLVSDARLLLLPVRSLNSVYKWVTCTHILERLHRDMTRTVQKASYTLPQLEDGQAIFSGEGTLFLEERSFSKQLFDTAPIIKAIEPLIKHVETRSRLTQQLVILSDSDFSWFARFGLPVMARNVLNNKTKTSDNLWYEETLPPDTVMYGVLAERQKDTALKQFVNLYRDHPYVQAGGNETVGQGWFVLSFVGVS
jgi:CRISPR-associated protein Cmr4